MSDSTFSLAGLTAVVTGSSSGIGRATAVKFARLGANVILHSRGPSANMDSTREIILGTYDVEVHTLFADFSDASAVETFAQDAWNWRGNLDVLVNNAGGDVLTGALKHEPLVAKFDYLMQVDVKTTLLLSNFIGRKMNEAQNSTTKSIINIGWDQAWQGMEGESGELFATTKGAIMSMTKSLAQSLAPSVRVNCIAPGWIKTAWGEQTSSEWDRRARRESLMDRWGEPEDIANVAAFLACPASEFISGHVLPVNGGFRYGN